MMRKGGNDDLYAGASAQRPVVSLGALHGGD